MSVSIKYSNIYLANSLSVLSAVLTSRLMQVTNDNSETLNHSSHSYMVDLDFYVINTK